MTTASPIREHIPVTVLLQRGWIERSAWRVPTWAVAGVLVGDAVTHRAVANGSCIRSDGAIALYSWSGYRVTLYKDACERYWHALIGESPLVYVVCREDVYDADAVQPLLVTCDYDEATAFAETDDRVLTAPIPAELYVAMERFVLTHYRPKHFHKRRRHNWTDSRER